MSAEENEMKNREKLLAAGYYPERVCDSGM